MNASMITNAASSGVKLDRQRARALMTKSDRAGLIWLAQWLAMLAGSAALVYWAMDGVWLWPAMLLHGLLLTLPSYALSHECAHGTVFRTAWLNELCFWLSSLIYFEEPEHRKWAHAGHHRHTLINGLDSQMPFVTPLTLPRWLREVSGLGQLIYESRLFVGNALGRFDPQVVAYTPEQRLPVLRRNARICLGIYCGGGALAVATGAEWLLWYLLIPRLLGGPLMLLVTLIQHAEMEEDQCDIRRSTRSCRSGRLGCFLYMNMNYHIEHHLFPAVPFHALPALNAQIREQLPAPDPGFIRTNWAVFVVALRRSLGRSAKTRRIRQADTFALGSGAD